MLIINKYYKLLFHTNIKIQFVSDVIRMLYFIIKIKPEKCKLIIICIIFILAVLFLTLSAIDKDIVNFFILTKN